MSGQAAIFVQTIIIGLCAGLFYDVFRVMRLYIRHTNMVIHAQDIFFWLCMATAVFYIFLNRHYGEIRAFCFIGLALGMLLYFAALSALFTRGACAVINFIIKVIKWIFNLLSIPFKALYNLLKRPAAFIKSKIIKFFVYLKKVLQNIKNYVKIKMLLLKKDIRIMLKKI